MRQHTVGQGSLTQQAMVDSSPAVGKSSRVDELQRSLEASPIYRLDRTSVAIPADAGVQADDAQEAAQAEPSPMTEVGHEELRALGVEPRIEPSDATVPSAASMPNVGNPHHMADQDDFNRNSVASHDKQNNRQLNRPGVRFHTHKGDIDLLYPKRSAHRYVIDNHDQFIPKGEMIHPHTPVAFNLAPLRKHDGRTYALTWVNGGGSLWTSLSVFRDDDNLKDQIHAQSAGVLPSDKVGSALSARWVFRHVHDAPSADSQKLAANKDRYVLPNKPAGDKENKLDHYGYRPTHLYNVLLNLPQAAEASAGEAPPVAVDSAVPGWSFFVASGAQFRRQVPVFRGGQSEPDRDAFVTFVYGFLGQATRQGEQRDLHRRGWVPAGVLKPA